jgi:hypothetical protein
MLSIFNFGMPLDYLNNLLYRNERSAPAALNMNPEVVMFSLFRSKSKAEWWEEAFTPDELEIIEENFRPLGDRKSVSLMDTQDPVSIGYLIGHLKKVELRHLGYRLIEHADTLVSKEVPILSLHFYWCLRGDFFYRWRDLDAEALKEAVKSYQEQIALSLEALKQFQADKNLGFIPAHGGFRQLRIIEENRGNLELARNLCETAKAQGWNENWDKHIARIDKKMAKQSR